MKILYRIIPLIFLLALFPLKTFAANGSEINIEAPHAILIEKETGTIIYEKEAYTHRSPASVTKIMTLLLAAEAIDSGKVSLKDAVTASAKAASMGGSQIWLEESETMSFGEMLKCICVVSANDCCVAVAEHLSGSEEAFVAKMNERAEALGLKDTHFTCCSGLSDSDEHYSCARDLAIIARELLKYDFIKEYAGIWTDSVRNGEFVLNNTNKLIRTYAGASGLKTGFTSKAMHCLAASAERDNVEYIAVVLGAESSAKRFESAKTLLNYGFANYTLLPAEKFAAIAPLKVTKGKSDCVNLSVGEGNSILIPKDKAADIKWEASLPESIPAPVDMGQTIGQLTVTSGDETIAEIPIVAAEKIEIMGFMELFKEVLSSLTLR
ncbi:MAG: D-alanyl-D-alanine carboxypeptidase [Oscillospiraceae bacterium]|nr:D-alanyl-D-alanine carboxypeptidase [Oscillospiraceae bacterium]